MSDLVLSESARAMLDKPLQWNLLSARVQNALQREGVTTLRGLVTMSEQEIHRIPDVGQTSRREMRELLVRYGLAFGMELPPPVATTEESEQPVLPGMIEDPLDERDDLGEPGEAAAALVATYFVLEIGADSISQIFAKAFLGSRVPGRRVDLRILVTDGPGIVRHRFSGKVDLVSFARYTHEVLAGEETSLELTVLVANVDTPATLTCSRDGKVGRLVVQVPATAAT